jgi:hypothetical protein
VAVIDPLAQFTGFRGAEIFFEPLQLHLQPPDPLEQLGLFGLGFLPVIALFGTVEQLNVAIHELPLPLSHLDRVDGVVSGDLLDRLAATDGLHGDSGLELGAVGAALIHWWEPLSGAVPRLRG